MGATSDAVYTIQRESLAGKKTGVAGTGAKVLTVAWDERWGIVSAGEDKQVQVNRGKGILAGGGRELCVMNGGQRVLYGRQRELWWQRKKKKINSFSCFYALHV